MACRQHAARLALAVLSSAVAASRSTGVVVDGSAEAFQATQVDARKANFFSSGFRFRLPPAVSGVIIDIGLCDQILKPGPRQHVYVPRPPSLPPLAPPLTSHTCLVHTGLLLRRVSARRSQTICLVCASSWATAPSCWPR